MIRQLRKLRSGPAIALTALLLAVGMILGLISISAGLLDPEPERVAIIDIVDAISDETTAATESYFAGPQAAAEVIANTVAGTNDTPAQLDLLRDLTLSQPNLDGAFVGFPNGDFLDARHDIDDRIRIKTITVANGEKASATNFVNAAGEVVYSFTTPNDQYNPTTRPWYTNAGNQESNWTDPYVFFTSQEQGITYSVPVFAEANTITAVVGVDIRLTELEEFLEARRPSENGGAVVVSNTGALMAGTSQLDFSTGPLHDILAATEQSTETRHVITDESLVVSVSPLVSLDGRFLIVFAPESDFLDGVRSDRQTSGYLALVLGAGGLLLLLLGSLVVRRSLRALAEAASTDALTGLLNRAAFYRRVERALEDGSELAVLTVDLDSFKLINDQFGHHGGDEALVQTGARLAAAAPTDAVIARLGGDEFCIAVIDHPNAEQVCDELADEASGPIGIDGYVVELRLSAGYVMTDKNLRHPASLMERADLAMYTAKSLHGTSTVRFDQNMSARWKLDIERRIELEEAVVQGQMEVYFQPEVDLSTGELLGAEALLRWNHPTHGLVAAHNFVDELERFDLMRRLLPMVYLEAEQLANSVSVDDDFTIRMNVSAKQLLSAELFDLFDKAVRSSNIRWAIEVHEETISTASPVAMHTLDRLREIGVLVVVDDYGAGRSSLAQLRTLPIDALKITPAFVQSLESNAAEESLASVLSDLSRVLGVDVLATGVQTHEQRRALVEAGYRQGQGYLYSPPLKAEEFINWCKPARRENAA